MLAVERQDRILDMLTKSRAVATARAAKVLAVSEETVRRDFEKLEADGQLARKHGGAIRLNDSQRDLSLDSRELANVAEKKAIARAVLAQIQAGETVFFDASSTVFHLAGLLPNLEVTVLTNALKTAIELARRSEIQVILVGGVISHRSLSSEGTLADQILDSYHIQKAFVSCRGLDAERGLSEANVGQAGLKRKIVRLADRTIVLADHTKMGLKSSYFFAGLHEVDLLVSDRSPARRVKQKLLRGGGKLLVPKENHD
ncbi:MAG TPA: DeoR/GlpR family DNA-binding transcription regulator [Candidatus Acidoferrales bacterium]|nr:DeoR/GlpR family DNA-binding transcription regulator [Candidatus Acidoferrales bacterium]